MNRSALAQQLHDWRLTPEPQRFTQLYFANPAGLANNVAVANTPHTLAFTIRNTEHQTTAYRYRIVAKTMDRTRVRQLSEGRVILAHNKSRTINENITVPLMGQTVQRVMVKVELEYKGLTPGDDMPSLQRQSIHYWVSLNSTPPQSEDAGGEA